MFHPSNQSPLHYGNSQQPRLSNSNPALGLRQLGAQVQMKKPGFPASQQSEVIPCSVHENEQITNFCSCLECLMPLCPECVTTHNQQHKLAHSYAEIETMRSVKQRCQSKLTSAAAMIESSVSSYEKALEIPLEGLDENIAALRRYRKRIEDIIDTHFKSIEDMLVSNVNTLRHNNTPFLRIFDQMKSAAREFTNLSSELNSHRNSISNLQRVCSMDVQAVIQRFKSDLNRMGGQVNSELLIPRLDDTRLFYFVEELEKVVSVQSTELPDVFSLSAKQQQQQQQQQNSQQQQSSMQLPSNENLWQQQLQQQQQQQQQLHQNFVHQPSVQKYFIQKKQQLTPSNQSPHEVSASTSVSSHDILYVTKNDFFEKKAPRKFLHFFQNDENKLHYIDLLEVDAVEQARSHQLSSTSPSSSIQQQQQLPRYLFAQASQLNQQQQQQLRVVTVELNIGFLIPSFHKSIASSQGELYLTGGTIPDGSMNKSAHIYQYDWSNQSLISLGCMSHARSSHGIAILNNKIYVVGGYENKHVMTKRCERFNLSTKKWESVASLTYSATSLSLCSFGSRYLFKFGGIGEGYDNFLLSPYIERYDVMRDVWDVIDPKLSEMSRMGEIASNFGLLSTSASVQISDTEIFVFGGYHEDNSGSNQSFVLSIESSMLDATSNAATTQNLADDQSNCAYFIKSINQKLLPSSEAFWNNVPIIHNKKIFALQNIAGEHSDNCLENDRKVIVFNEKEWKALN